MKKIVCVITLTILISACGLTSPKSDNKEIGKQENASTGSNSHSQSTEKITQLDSIEKANNESVIAAGDNITKAYVFLKDGDSTIHLTANIQHDHRIFGYSDPDIKSERLLLLSVFTNDVENNPFGCRLGAYYDTGGMDELILKYVSTTGTFVKAKVTDKSNNVTTLFFEKKWIELE